MAPGPASDRGRRMLGPDVATRDSDPDNDDGPPSPEEENGEDTRHLPEYHPRVGAGEKDNAGDDAEDGSNNSDVHAFRECRTRESLTDDPKDEFSTLDKRYADGVDAVVASGGEGTNVSDQLGNCRAPPLSTFGTGERDGERRGARMRRIVRQSSVGDLSRRLSLQMYRRSSSIVESLPDTPAGWAALTAVLSSVLLGHELRLQRSLTCPPTVFAQSHPRNDRIRKMLSTPPERGILSRNIKPSLWVGTRGVLSSAAAYAVPHIGRKKDACELNARLRFREVLTMGADGARVGIDWEIPPETYECSFSPRETAERRMDRVFRGPISRPIVIILHGINNDASFGYIRSLMRACTDRGWIAVGYNYRGCGGVPLATPRGYTGSYTGDLRDTIRQICARTTSADVPIFLVGNSLGANLITKYLGEEGYSGTLPPNIAGGVSLGNPLHIHSGNMSFPWAQLLGMGVRKSLFLTRDKWRQMTCHHFQRAYIKALLLCQTIGEVDETLSPFLIRNDPEHPFSVRVGYRDGEDYWDDASSYKYVPHVSVPLLKVTAQDDFLVYGSSLRRMSQCLENPNVTVVKTKCGGHLGWQESPPDTESAFGFGTSWADTATTEFIAAVMELREEDIRRRRRQRQRQCDSAEAKAESESKAEPEENVQYDLPSAKQEIRQIRSRL